MIDFRKIKLSDKVIYHSEWRGDQFGEVIKVYNSMGKKTIEIHWSTGKHKNFTPHISVENKDTISENFDWKIGVYKKDFEDLINGVED